MIMLKRLGVLVLILMSAAFAYAQSPATLGPVDAYNTRSAVATLPFQKGAPTDTDAIQSTDPVDAQWSWIFDLYNHDQLPIPNASITINSPLTGVNALLWDSVLKTTTTGEIPFPYVLGTTNLTNGLEQRFTNTSIVTTITPGFTATRIVSPLVLPAAGGTQTTTVKVTVVDPKYLASSTVGTGLRVWIDLNPGVAAADSFTTPDPFGGESGIFAFNTGNGMNWLVGNPVLNQEYVFTMTQTSSNTKTKLGAPDQNVKPAVRVQMNTGTAPVSQPNVDSVNTHDDVLSADLTFSVAPDTANWNVEFTPSENVEVDFPSMTQDAATLPEFTSPADGDVFHVSPNTPLEFHAVATNAISVTSPNLPDGASLDAGLALKRCGKLGSGGGDVDALFSWTPQSSDIGTHPVTFAATDCSHNSVSINVTIIVDAPLPPVFISPTPADGAAFDINVNASLQFTVAAQSPSHQNVTLSATSVPAWANFDPLSGNFMATPNVAGSFPITFTATDPNGSTSTSVVINVTNHAPQFDPPTPAEGSTFTVNVNAGEHLSFTVAASDPDHDLVNLSAASLPPGANFPSSGPNFNVSGPFDWTPNNTQAGSYTASFIATDSHGLSATRTVNITVNYVNHAPTFGAPSPAPGTVYNISPGQSLNISLQANDQDAGDVVTLALSNNPTTGTLNTAPGSPNAGGTFSWTPNNTGTFNLNFTASDGHGGVANLGVTINVVNHPPAFVAPSPAPNTVYNVNIGQQLLIQLQASDPDAFNVVTLALPNNPTTGTLNTAPGSPNAGGTFSWTPNNNQLGTYALNFTASDAYGGITSLSVTVNVVNRAPTFTLPNNPPTAAVQIGQAFSQGIAVNDQDPGDLVGLSFTISPNIAGPSLTTPGPGNPLNSTFNWTPNATTPSGQYTITLTATDNHGATAQNIFFVYVNRPPTFSAPSPATINLNYTPGMLVQFNVAASDSDPNDFIQILGLQNTFGDSAVASTGPGTGTFNWHPGGSGSFTFNLRAVDAHNGQTIYPVLINLNAAPVFTNPAPGQTTIVNVGGNLSIIPTVNDEATDVVSFSFTITPTPPAGNPLPTLTAPAVSGTTTKATLNWTPSLAERGQYSVTFTATDSHGLSSNRSTTIFVNGPPTFTTPNQNQNFTFVVGTTSNFQVSANDSDAGDTVTLSYTSNPAIVGTQPNFPTPTTNGVASSTFQWAPTSAQIGNYTLTFTATDSHGASTVRTVGITVRANTPPSFTSNFPASITIPVGNFLAFSMTASDPDGNPVTISAVPASLPSGASIAPGQGQVNGTNPAAATLSWGPSFAQAGQTYTVILTATDSLGAQTTRALPLIVTAPVPSFSMPLTGRLLTPAGACICTPVLMNTNSAGVEEWFVKAGPTGNVDLTLFAVSVNPTDPETVTASVYDGSTAMFQITAHYNAGQAQGTEISTSGTIHGTPGNVYRVEIATPNTPGTQAHYRLKFTGADEIGMNSPSFASLEDVQDSPVRWLLNVPVTSDLSFAFFTAGTPSAQSPGSLTYQLIDPNGQLAQTATIALAASGAPITITGAAPGVWTLAVTNATSHYRINRAGTDPGIYASWATYGEGGINLTIDPGPYPVAQVKAVITDLITGQLISKPGPNGDDMLPVGNATFNAGVGRYHVELSVPDHPEYIIAPVDITVTCDATTVVSIALQTVPTVQVTGGSFAFDGQSHEATATATGFNNGPVNGTFSFFYNPGGSFAPTKAGTTPVTATFTSNSPYYTNATGNGSIVITATAPTVQVTGGTFTYDGQQHAATAVAIGLDGFPVQGSFNITYDVGGSTAPTQAGTYAVTAVFTSTDPNYAGATGTGSLLINKADATITVTPYSLTYDGAAHTATGTATGVAGADLSAGLSLGSTTHTNAGTYADTWSFDGGANYNSTTGTANDSIAKATVTVTANNTSKTYGGSTPNGGVTIAGLIGSDTLTTTASAGASANTPAGTYPIVPDVQANPNYAVTVVNGTLTINPAPLTITAVDSSKPYGAANPAFTLGYSGFVASDTAASLTGTPAFATSATAASPVSTYAVTPSGLSNANYTITFVPGTLTVNKVPLTVTANNATKVAGTANPSFTATYTGLVNGDTQASLGSPTLTTTATTASPAGTYPIVPSGLSLANYTVSYVNGTLTVAPAANNPPDAKDDAATTTKNTAVTINVLANDTDPDGNALSIVSVTGVTHGTASIVAGGILFVPENGFTGTTTFTYKISDGHGGTDTATVKVTVVKSTNHLPDAYDDLAKTSKNTPVTIGVLANDTDPDGDALTITSVSHPDHGTAVIVNGKIVYTPASGFTGTDCFMYTISDGHGGTDRANVRVIVSGGTAINHPPDANDDSAKAVKNTSVLIAVLANDTDQDHNTLSIASVSDPDHGSTVISGNKVMYTPDTNYTGPDSFTYKVSDGHGGFDTATVRITVKASANQDDDDSDCHHHSDDDGHHWDR